MDSELENSCYHCRKTNLAPGKKCAKSHTRCKGRLFCDKNCEKEFHFQEKNAAANTTEAEEERIPQIDENRLKIEAEMKRELKKSNKSFQSINRSIQKKYKILSQ